ncbi:MAG: alanine--tRNA ligase, partial [Burkholderiaceae bacterium]
LPKPSVDTGMGLERVTAVLQHVHGNYEIDTFVNLLAAAKKAVDAAGGGDCDAASPSLKVIADHIRACSFTIVDGVIPGNAGRGYVLRRIARRAIRHGYKLGARAPFFHGLVAPLAAEMGEAYPELRQSQPRITDVLRQEEERFFKTIANGMEILEAALASGTDQIDGETAFKLHDTFGFPVDLTGDVCRERGVTVDEAGFNALLEEQKRRAREAGKFKMAQGLGYTGQPTAFHGYERLVSESARVTAVYVDGSPVAAAKAGEDAVVVLDQTPFYAESGGQVGDTGELRNATTRMLVEDTVKIQADVFGHHGRVVEGGVSVGDAFVAKVDAGHRARTMRNHSATHLMHKALREVLGAHVQQKGSLVNADRTRFDFAHTGALTDAQIRRVEEIVNAEVLDNAQAEAVVMALDDAQESGAMMLFGEKYGDRVRVLSIGSSKELCGGTHVRRTGDIGLFKVVAESGVAAGVRRIEAVTGDNALGYLQALEDTVDSVAGALKVAPAEVPSRLGAVLDHVKALEKELEKLKGKLASAQGDELAARATAVKGMKVLAARIDGADAKTLRDTMDKLKDKLKTAAIVLAAVDGDKVQIAAGVTADSTSRVKAGELVNFVAQQVGGKGGGKPDMAMAGGTDAAKLPGALASVQAWVADRI